MTEIQKALSSKDRSLLQKYMDLCIGQRSFAKLFAYETVILCSRGLPGALGLAVRKITYPLIIGTVGRNVLFGSNITLRHPHKIHMGTQITIDEGCLLDAKGESNRGIFLEDGVFVGRQSILSCKNGDIHLGKRVNVGFHAEIFSGSEVRVGEGTFVAAYAYLIGGGHAYQNPDIPIFEQERLSKGITVGKRCWIGAGSKILDGSVIGDDVIIGACSLVKGTIPPMTIAVGSPAEVVRERRSPESKSTTTG
jgi:acetyltransferase-like isoleucine patch superfamily enzyme